MRGLRPALAIATILVGIGAVARTLDRGPGSFPDLQVAPGQSPDIWEPVLIAAAGLCVAGLTVRRSPWLAWFSTALASALGAVDLIAQVRAQLVEATPTGWPALVGASAAAAIAAAAVCALLGWHASFELDDRRVGSALRAIAALGLLAIVGVQAGAVLASLDPASMLLNAGPIVQVRAANRALLLVLAADLGVAAFLVAGPRTRRAWARSDLGAPAPSEGDGRAPGLLQALADEFVPGLRSRGDLAAAAERERLAADLHARVVPELRRAVAAGPSSGTGSPPDLSSALDGIESIMAERHSVVLDEFGLLAALEWLAERTEARSRTTVEINVDDVPDAGRPPRDVERAVFRIALVAMDNAVRHAPAAAVAVSVSAAAREVRLTVADLGPGIDLDEAAAARREGHRGLSDMAAAAAAVRGQVTVGPSPNGVGTLVSFTWRAR